MLVVVEVAVVGEVVVVIGIVVSFEVEDVDELEIDVSVNGLKEIAGTTGSVKLNLVSTFGEVRN